MQTVTSSTGPEGRVSADRMAALHIHLADPEGAMRASLHALVQRVAGARGAAIADANGLPIASTFPDRDDMRLASALATMIARASHLVLDSLEGDRFHMVTLEGTGNVILAVDVSEGVGTLILIMDPIGDIAGARREILRTAMEVTTILDLDVV